MFGIKNAGATAGINYLFFSNIMLAESITIEMFAKKMIEFEVGILSF